MSVQGAKTLSHLMFSSLLRTPYSILTPRFDMPISYESGKQKANEASTDAGSLTVCPNSPPAYLPGFDTDLSKAGSVIFIIFPASLSL